MITFQAPLVIVTLHTFRNISILRLFTHAMLLPEEPGQGTSPVDGSDTTLMDANYYKSQQKKKTTVQARIYVYAEDFACYFQERGGRGAAFVRCSCNLFNIQHICETGHICCDLLESETCTPYIKKNIKWALEQLRHQIQIHHHHHQQSIAIGSLAPRECVFRQTYILYLFVSTMSLVSLTTQPCHSSLTCHLLLRWEIGGTDFPVYQLLLPSVHDFMQEMFLPTFQGETACMKGA